MFQLPLETRPDSPGEPAMQQMGLDPWVGKIPWRRTDYAAKRALIKLLRVADILADRCW